VSLQCEANGATSYRWERQRGRIPSSAIGLNTNTLTFINPKPENAGNYRCVAINASGISYSKYAALTVNGKMHIINRNIFNTNCQQVVNVNNKQSEYITLNFQYVQPKVI